MTTIDEPNTYKDPSGVPYFQTALRYGVIGGLILVVWGLIAQMTGMADPCAAMEGGSNSIVVGLLSMLVLIGVNALVGVLAIRQHTGDLGGYIPFGRAFVVALVTLIIAGLISGLFNVVYTTVVDPGFSERVMGCMEAQYEAQGMDPEQIDTAMGFLKYAYNPIFQLVTSLFSSAFFGAIVGLILAAIMKKNPPTSI
jgi:hypothetical protein